MSDTPHQVNLSDEAADHTKRITYSTNMMGPYHLNWYRQRGLTKFTRRVLEEDSIVSNKKKGDVVEFEEIIERYAGGRIDVYGTGEFYGDEIGVPVMSAKDWNFFGKWLETFQTEEKWTLKQLVSEYEKVNPKIKWANEL